MKDLIEERDKKEKMKHSIVKWWNVHYMTPDELGEDQSEEESAEPEEDPAINSAQEILDRLNREAEENEARKREEIEEAKLLAEGHFNESTGAYSGLYGTGQVKDEERERINAILAEKDEALKHLIERTGQE